MKTTIISSIRHLGLGQEHHKNTFKTRSKYFFLAMMLLVAALAAQAQTKRNAKYTIDVNGNCEQCQKRIQKAAFSVAGVKTAVWSIETHKLDLTINEEKTSVDAVKKAIAKVGHDTNDVKATKEDYDSLHHCCQYDREQKIK